MLQKIPRWVRATIVLFWMGSLFTGLLAIRLDPTLDFDGRQWLRVLCKQVLLSVYWMAVTLAVFGAMHGRVGVDTRVRLTARVLLLSLMVCAGMIAWFGTVIVLVSAGEHSWLEGARWLGPADVLSSFLTALAVVLAAAAWDYYRLAAERERHSERLRLRLAQAEVVLLRGQLEPHFLFNALNSIAALVRLGRSHDAIDALARLGELLRGILEVGQRTLVPWDWECAFTRAYVALQALRFGDRLDVRFEGHLPSDSKVPPMVLQPLVENAIRHGPLADGSSCRIDIGVAREREHATIRVDNDVACADSGGAGIGLANLSQRIGRLFGDAAQCSWGRAEDGHFRVTIRFPLRVDDGSDE